MNTRVAPDKKLQVDITDRQQEIWIYEAGRNSSNITF